MNNRGTCCVNLLRPGWRGVNKPSFFHYRQFSIVLLGFTGILGDFLVAMPKNKSLIQARGRYSCLGGSSECNCSSCMKMYIYILSTHTSCKSRVNLHSLFFIPRNEMSVSAYRFRTFPVLGLLKGT